MGSLRAMVENRVGPYLLADRLGSGGMAEVWVGQNVETGSPSRFAIKRILPQLSKDSRFVAMFCDEARICAALHHPNIVRVLDFGEHHGELFMAMEYVEGTSCARLLRNVAARGRRFPLNVALFIAREVLEALAYAHDALDEKGRSLGIVHRDVSPGNILVSSSGEVKLTDFGIVRSEFIARRTYPGELKGKIGYMSPEQVVGGDVDPRSDLFALGIVLAEMLLTRPLFPGRSEMETLTRIYEADLRTLDQHGDDLPRELVEILRWTLQRRPNERPRSARELAQSLDRFAIQESVEPASANLVNWLRELGLLGSRSGVRAATPNPDERGELRAMQLREGSPEALKRRSSLPPRIASQADGHLGGAVYEIRLSNGEVLSPLGSYEFLESYATRRVSLNAVIVKNNGRPRSARQFACLSNIIATEDWLESVLQSRMAFCHALDRSRFPTFLFGLVSREETATIVARDGSRVTAIAWERGTPVYAVSSDREMLLGSHLVRGGIISEEQLLRAVETLAEGDSGRLGDVLVDQRSILPADLLRALVDQLRSRILSLGSWESGEFWYVPGASAPFVGVRVNESSLGLLASMVRTAFSGRELARVLAVLGDGPIAASPVQRIDSNSLGLTLHEGAALKSVAGTHSLSRFMTEAVGHGAMRPDDILRAVFIGLSAGLLVSPGWPWR
jgi:eukaryotic-like serine/threonine-protein kinase